MACNTINVRYRLVCDFINVYPVSLEPEPDFDNVYPVSFEPEPDFNNVYTASIEQEPATGNGIQFRFLIRFRLPKYPVPGRIIPIRLKPSIDCILDLQHLG